MVEFRDMIMPVVGKGGLESYQKQLKVKHFYINSTSSLDLCIELRSIDVLPFVGNQIGYGLIQFSLNM